MKECDTFWVHLLVGVPDNMTDAEFRTILGDYTRQYGVTANYTRMPVCHGGDEECFTVTMINHPDGPDVRGHAEKLALYLLGPCKQHKITVQFPKTTYDVVEGDLCL